MAKEAICVSLTKVEEIGISSKTVDTKNGKEYVTKISFEGDFSVSDIARILNLSRQGRPIEVSFSSPQAEFDLDVKEVSIKTGEVK